MYISALGNHSENQKFNYGSDIFGEILEELTSCLCIFNIYN